MTTYSAGQHREVIERHRQGMAFNEDRWQQLSLERQDLAGLRMFDSRLERCGFTEVILDGGRLDDCRISNTSMRQLVANRVAWVDSRVRLSDMAGAQFKEACLNTCRFDETLMAGIELDGATLTGCDFDICDLTGASFSNALVMRCKFKDNRLGSANLISSDFSGAQLVDVDLREANLQSANLTDALFVRVHLQGANFQSANLTGATFVECKGVPEEVRAEIAEARRRRASRGRPAARGVDLDLDQSLEHLSQDGLVRVSRELLRTYVVEAAGALLSQDPAAALLRQRSLRFSDLIRFVKENFPHDEFKQILVEGESVYVRTPAGDIPLTSYGGRPTQTGGGPPAQPPPMGREASREPSSPSPLPAPDLPAGMPRRDTAGASERHSSSSDWDERDVSPAASPPDEPPPADRRDGDDDAFEPDRFGMIDI